MKPAAAHQAPASYRFEFKPSATPRAYAAKSPHESTPAGVRISLSSTADKAHRPSKVAMKMPSLFFLLVSLFSGVCWSAGRTIPDQCVEEKIKADESKAPADAKELERCRNVTVEIEKRVRKGERFGQKEQKELFDLAFLSAAVNNGPRMLKCQRPANRDRLVENLFYIDGGLKKINKKFPKYDVEGDLQRNTTAVCDFLMCDKPGGALSCDESEFSKQLRDSEYWRKEVAIRLAYAGLDMSPAAGKSTQAAKPTCGASAQHYQDQLKQNNRVKDLLCYKQALQRELR